ncbi:MAG: MFS transporter [Bacteroidia bacterium]|nr:MFS transporter [Bacteroidia bacterium]
MKSSLSRFPASWVPSLYFAESLPYMLINIVAIPMYQDMGLSESLIPLYVGFLGYAWMIKPLWSPLVQFSATRRWWTLAMQLILAIGFALVGMVVQTGAYFIVSFSLLATLSFVSATHDIAIDGYYLEVLSEKEQSLFIGIRNFFYRLGMLFSKGPLLIFVGMLILGQTFISSEEMAAGSAYAYGWYLCAAIFGIMWVYHSFILPKEKVDEQKTTLDKQIEEIGQEVEAEKENEIAPKPSTSELLSSFFKKEKIGIMIAFLLLYRLGESQIQAIGQTFLKMDVAKGGLGLSTTDFGVIYGTYGATALIIGGILGGLAISEGGLKKWLWPMIVAINVPNLLFVYMSFYQPQNYWIISACISLEQFGYGFGFTAFLMYMIYMSQGHFKTAHYAIATGFMALGNILPLQLSGFIKEWLGDYTLFFSWTLIATIPAFIIAAYIPLDKEFGKKGR